MLTLRGALLATALAALPLVPAQADVILDDPLHGECAGCIDTGSVTPLPTGTTTFGFSSSPPNLQGNLFLKVLIPDNEIGGFTMPTINSLASPFTGGIALRAAGIFSTGDLDAFLVADGFAQFAGGTPAQPIGGFLNANEFGVDAGATGFDVFVLNVGNTGVNGLTGPGIFPSDDLFQLGGLLPVGTYITAELVTSTGQVVNTALSGALLVQHNVPPPPPPPIPEPMTLALFGAGLVGLGLMRRRKSA